MRYQQAWEESWGNIVVSVVGLFLWYDYYVACI